ncbi:lipid II:glycine glycyltransferase FemX [Ruegeria meonggei]|uniref:FemAB family protein n=1 Tax=Ruegeria meonggei TaxID=1446476 RepID=A0A1X7AD77_9RHOB|nr:GNAT family N-acetyltransferase [Ruegeria meonggei]SLN76061.1 FemAB family protein [Ruegeria meonggei]
MNMTSRPFSLHTVQPKDWPQLSAAFLDLTYEQSLTYARAAAARIGAEVSFVSVSDASEQPVAAACLRIKRVPGLGRGIIWIAAGPLIQHRTCPNPDTIRIRAILAALRTHAQKTGHILRLRLPASFLQDLPALNGLAEQEGFMPSDRSPPYRTVIVDCDQDEDTLMRALHGKWRNPLRNALKAKLTLECMPVADGCERFRALYDEVQAAKGFSPDIPPDFYYPLRGPDFTHDLLIARKDGTDVACMTIGRSGTRSVYLFGATPEIGRRLNAGHYLMWQAILHSRKLGIKHFDLGGIHPQTNPSVTRFKQRTGGVDVTAPGPYEFRPANISSPLIRAAEALHTHLKARR